MNAPSSKSSAYFLTEASVFYGNARYDLGKLPNCLMTIGCLTDLNEDQLAYEVGRLTGFPRRFRIAHVAPIVLPAGMTRDGKEVVLPEQIVATANGYLIRWEKRPR